MLSFGNKYKGLAMHSSMTGPQIKLQLIRKGKYNKVANVFSPVLN